MPRYIDAEDAIYELERAFPIDDYGKIIRCISRTPTADVVERKVGKWKLGYCSECGYYWGKDAPIANVPNYCPNCGAEMRKETEDEDNSQI